MPTPIAMPKLGMTMQEGRVVAWPVGQGAPVEKGQVVLLIESEKAEVEIEAPAAGVLRHIYVEPDSTVPCGTLLAAITATADESFDANEYRRGHDRPAAAPPAPAAAQTRPALSAARVGGAPATPAARALARELGVDLTRVVGRGPGGRVTREDVEAWAGRPNLVEVAAGVRLEVPSQGQGDVVVLLPGFGTDVSAFAPLTAVLAERFRVVGVNPRGVAGSDAPAVECYDLATAAADAAATLGGPAHVVGASLGAAVAIELGLSRPDLVRSLTLVTPFVVANGRLLAVLDAWCEVARSAAPDTLAFMLLPWLFSAGFLSDAAVRDRTRRGLAATVARVPVATLERSAAGLRAWSGTRAADLTSITAPTLVLAGGEDLLAPDGARIGASIPQARTHVVPNAGHAIAIEAVEAVRASVIEHLSR